jgi:hypothetical protein
MILISARVIGNSSKRRPMAEGWRMVVALILNLAIPIRPDRVVQCSVRCANHSGVPLRRQRGDEPNKQPNKLRSFLSQFGMIDNECTPI